MVRLNVRTAWQLAQTNSHLEISWRMAPEEVGNQ